MNTTAQQTSSPGGLVEDEERPYEQGSRPSSPTIFSPGNSDTPQEDSEQMTHGEQGYQGYQPEGLNDLPGQNPPVSGDVDPQSTKSAQDTGQDGDLSRIEKKKAFNYDG